MPNRLLPGCSQMWVRLATAWNKGPDGGPGVELVGTVIQHVSGECARSGWQQTHPSNGDISPRFPRSQGMVRSHLSPHKEVDGGSGTPGETATMTLECNSFIPGKAISFCS